MDRRLRGKPEKANMPKVRERINVKCEACGLEGEITVGEMERVDCPECGAGYIAWRPHHKLKLRCVVRPIFAKRPND